MLTIIKKLWVCIIFHNNNYYLKILLYNNIFITELSKVFKKGIKKNFETSRMVETPWYDTIQGWVNGIAVLVMNHYS